MSYIKVKDLNIFAGNNILIVEFMKEVEKDTY